MMNMKSLGTTRTIKVPAGQYCNRDVKCRFLYYTNHDEELPRCGIDGRSLTYEADSALIKKCWACQMACEKGA